MRIQTFTTTALALLMGLFSNAQTSLKLSSQFQKSFTIDEKTANTMEITLAVPNLQLSQELLNGEDFIALQVDDFGKTYESGAPDLPQRVQLICVPKAVNLNLSFTKNEMQPLNLNNQSIKGLVKPAIASVSKSDTKKVRYEKGPVYQQNAFNNTPAVTLKEAGIMRGIKIYELVYHPFLYNAVTNELLIRNEVKVNLSWEQNTFNALQWDFLNPQNAQQMVDSDTRSMSGREVFVLISPAKFKNTLQPFIQWKTKQGYQVIEAYIGEELASNNKDLIKNYVKNLYENPQEGTNPASYLLLVGDVVDIPAWNGTTDYHVTDLYYAEFTGDFLPELYYGRFSAITEGQLETIINKTIYVEQGAGADGSYQNKHLLVSGVDPDFAPVYGNGAINYFLDYYATSEFGIEPSFYLYGSGSPITSNNSQAKQAILSDYSDGVGLAYYTAHCSQYGWSSPQFETSDIASVTNTDKYPLMIGNCCQSFKFETTSFGEEIVRASGKGAVVYIGATDYSYWDEDYYWGVGFTNQIVVNPTYEGTGIGSFDAWFHSHGESGNDIAFTAGQIVNVGNLAVQASTSNLKNYYWEVYGIMGDPSLMPARFRYAQMVPEFNEILTVGQNALNVKAASGSNITLFENGNLVAFAKVDESGTATLNFDPLVQIGDKAVELNIIHPDYLPYSDSLRVIAPDGPFLIMETLSLKDLEGNALDTIYYGQSVSTFYTFKNYGNQDATNITLTVSSQNNWIEPLANNQIQIAEIKSGASFTTTTAIDVKILNNTPDQELIEFKGSLEYQADYNSDFTYKITVNAPDLAYDQMVADQTGTGNLDGIIGTDETVTLDVVFANYGHAQVTNTVVSWSSSDESLLQVLTEPAAIGGFEVGGLNACSLRVKGGSDLFPGAQVRLFYTLLAGENQQFEFAGYIPVTLGAEPEINMSNGKEEIISGYFFDSGGANDKYGNSENYTLTFVPHIAGQGLIVDFMEFDVESSSTGCWDKLMVYDGDSTNAPLIGKFCNSNAVTHLQSSNPEGALTFTFTSDNNTTLSGWKAHISSSPMGAVTFKIINGVDGISGALVSFANQSDTTNGDGEITFTNILSYGEKSYSITKQGYFTQTGTINELEGDTTLTLLMEPLPDICFTIHDATTLLENVAMTFDGRTLFSDANGAITFVDVMPGTKTFKASKAGYVDTTGVIVVDKIDVCLNVSMRPKPTYEVTIQVNDSRGLVSDALVVLGVDSIYSDNTGKAVFTGIYAGNYALVVKKDGYITKNSAVDVLASDVVKDIELAFQTFGAYFTVMSGEEAIAGATITLLDQELTTSYYGEAFMNGILPANEIPFSVSHDAFNTYESTFDITNGDVEIMVNLTKVGIKPLKAEELQVYPNPLNKNRELFVASEYQIQQLMVLNNAGVQLINEKCASKEYLLNLSGIKAGIYILQVKTEKAWVFEKLIVN